jgi:hypothetical protein
MYTVLDQGESGTVVPCLPVDQVACGERERTEDHDNVRVLGTLDTLDETYMYGKEVM